ncbi:GNAT family N-acetyltransferase [Veronia nyctiphanis]|uniref:GNAT family N-acetyltransferase n=1 Tax=Veronia nyctiphanis TaxID=1278244 RepID=A0A4Q0YSC2_9GAMM|nr:GNAT family N-acetyltransferase [Veronia nyctiphanis]RXJ71999.1 GNAT family N-acetyltransferase [Veronia nyctiphanis]
MVVNDDAHQRINIREARESDLKPINRLYRQINVQHYQGAPEVFAQLPDEQHQEMGELHRQICDAECHFAVAEFGGNIIGYVTARIKEAPKVSFLRDHLICRVDTIVVSESAQGLGVGSSLMANVKAWALYQGATELRLEVMEFNQGAIEFYHAQGMETQSRIMSMSLDDSDI